MTQEEKTIEIPFGAKDSELLEWVYYIPEGMEAEIKDRKVIIKKAESEDERIRSGLIKYLESDRDCQPCQDISFYEEAIAYLEKQKELDKMIVVSPEVWDTAIADAYENGKKDGEKQKEPHYTKRNALFDKCVENCDPNVMREVSDKIDEMLEKEQKPEWSEEDRDILRDAICAADILAKDFKKDNPHLAKTLIVAKEWLESLPERFNLQPKQEWSEEDEKMLIGIVERGNSEIPKGECGLTPNQVAWLETRLKSLRPSWKPSEEQMKALEDAFRKDGSDEYRRTINSLYQDLKKLM